MVSMAREVEKLRAELANADARPRVSGINTCPLELVLRFSMNSMWHWSIHYLLHAFLDFGLFNQCWSLKSNFELFISWE